MARYMAAEPGEYKLEVLMHYIGGAGLLDFGEVAPSLSLSCFLCLSLVLSRSLSLAVGCAHRS